VSAAPRASWSIFGFPLRVSPVFWLVAVMFGVQPGEEYTSEMFVRLGLWVVALFVSILWHELGHAFAMRRFGYAPSIELYGMGGRTMWGRGPRDPSPGKRILVSLAGPGFGFALGGAVYGLQLLLGQLAPAAAGHWAVGYFVRTMLWVNLIWGAVNLVPMLPWDGGHVLEGALDKVTRGRGRKPAAIVTIVLSIVLGLALVLLLDGPMRWWPALLCLLSLSVGVRVLRAKPPSLASPELEPRAALERARQILERAGSPERLVSAVLMGSRAPQWRALAVDLEERVAPAVISPAQRATALELAAWAHLLAGDAPRAEAVKVAMRDTHDPSPILEALVAAKGGRFEEALEAVEAIHPEEAAGAKRIEAYALAAQRRPESAMAAIADDRAAGALVDAALFQAGAYDEAADLAAHLFDRFGEAEDAYNAACSHARAGRAEEGLSWLERAVDAGYHDLAHLESDEDLAAVRALEGFGTLRSRLRAARSRG